MSSKAVGAVRSRGQEAGSSSGAAEAGGGHVEGFEDFFKGKIFEGFAGDAFDDVAEDFEVDVAVEELFAGGAGEVEVGEVFPGGFGAVLVVGEGVVGDEAGAVAEELFEGDDALAVVVELGEEVGKGLIEAELAALEEDHDGGGGGEGLGEGGHVEDGVARHGGGVGLHLAVSDRLDESDLAVAADKDDGSGDDVVVDGLVDGFGDSGEAGGVEAEVGGGS